MNYGVTAEKMPDLQKEAMSASILKSMDHNLDRMHANVNQIEDQLHRILNNRKPQPEGKSETPMENDLDSALTNRLRSFSMLNERLEGIVNHLNKIV
jgi:hypothetical protein